MVRTSHSCRSWARALAISVAFFSGCAVDVESGDTYDDSGVEVDDTAAKDDGAARPVGRFEVADFESCAEAGTQSGFTYALDLNDPSRTSAREFGVHDATAPLVRREVSVRFTRSGAKRYIRLTDTNAATSPEAVVRFQYRLDGDVLFVRRVNTEAWIALTRVASAEDGLRESLHAFAADGALQEVGDTGDFMGELPLRVQLNVNYLHSVHGSASEYGVHAFDFSVYDPAIDTTRQAFELMVPIGRDTQYFFYDGDGRFIDRALLHGDEMRWGE